MMKRVSKGMATVGAGMIATGLVLMFAAFIGSGFNPRVFTLRVEPHQVLFGDVRVDRPEDIPILGAFMENHTLWVGIDARERTMAPEIPEAPTAPEAPTPPSAPETPEVSEAS